MDIRSPTHELTRAHAVLRARRRIATEKPGWALSVVGLDSLRGRGGQSDRDGIDADSTQRDIENHDMEGAGAASTADAPLALTAPNDRLTEALAAVDVAIAKTSRTLAGENTSQARRPIERDSWIYDLDWDEDARLPTGAPSLLNAKPCRRRSRQQSRSMPGTASNRCSIEPGLVLCWPQQHSANAARPARTSSACTKVLKLSRATSADRATKPRA